MQRSSADTSLTAVACTTAIWLGRHGFYRHPPDLIIPSFLSHLHLKIMPDSVKECVKSKTAFSMDLPGNHVSILNTIKKKRIWWTLDIHLLPLVSLLYFLSFLDRSNIGHAKIAGMSTDLHLDGLRYNVAAALFFITYSLVEVPSNIILKLTRPSLRFPTIMVAWGTVMALTSLVNTYQGLLISRVVLGLVEGGLFPGVAYYISLWYPRRIQGQRLAIFFSAATVAGAFGGILAHGIAQMDGTAGLHGWQWIFLVEGLATVVVALLSYYFMNDYPEMAKFLTEDERCFVVQALREDLNGQATYFNKKFVWQAFTDWKVYVLIVIHMCTLIPVYAVALFLPTIVHDLGYSATGAQLLTVPPFTCSCISTVVVGIYSDKVNIRGLFVLLGDVVSLIGYTIAYMTSNPRFGYAAAVIAASGVYPNVAIVLSWAGGNVGGDMKRGVVLAMVIGIGNLGGICASFIYYQPPRFYKGHATIIGCICMRYALRVARQHGENLDVIRVTGSFVCTSILMWKYRALNKEKEKRCIREGIVESMRDRYRELGDESPLFR
ncbi:MFS general substrate transporter [Russula ochroleuca]|uniref:MFS general substrate transporter n=1 Tax=Russula ochroleuca TaxID=152965 RepID=A0A9P5TB77_9AGAM|nr:MFS general substrate transporter [Russula ochroleuca]